MNYHKPLPRTYRALHAGHPLQPEVSFYIIYLRVMGLILQAMMRNLAHAIPDKPFGWRTARPSWTELVIASTLLPSRENLLTAV